MRPLASMCCASGALIVDWLIWAMVLFWMRIEPPMIGPGPSVMVRIRALVIRIGGLMIDAPRILGGR